MTEDAPEPTSFAILQCSVCHRAGQVTKADLDRFSKTGWPRCCDEVMVLRLIAEGNPDDD